MKSILFAAAFAFSVVSASNALAQSVVRLESAGEVGHGLAVARGDNCFVVTLKHVVGDAFESKAITPGRGPTALELVEVSELLVTLPDGEEVREDLALLRATANQRELCSDNLQPFENERRSFITTADGKGDIKIYRIDMLGVPNKTVSFEFSDTAIGQMKSMSGAPVMWGGKLVGLVVRLSTDADNSAQIAYDIELAAKAFGPWITGEELQVAAVDQALSVIERVREMLPASDIGQVAALKSIAKGGAPLAGLDLKGFYLDRARLDGLDFSMSDFSAATLNGAIMHKTHLSGAIFNFAVASGIQMQSADAPASHHEYANYDDGGFAGANFSRSNLLYASFRNADLSNVDFTNANLVYTDLTGANVAGANFTGALLNGATFTDVKGLDSAVFKDTSVTNMIGATSRQFSDTEVCGHFIGEKGYDHATIIQKSPSPRFDDGFKYDNILEYTKVSSYEFTPASIIGMAHYHFLRQCPAPPEEERAVGTDYYSDSVHAGYSSISVANKQFFHRDFLAKRGLKKYIPARMVERTTQTIQTNSARDFILPVTTRDMAAANLFKTRAASTRKRATSCLGNDIFTLRQLISFDGSAKNREGLLLDEIVETIRNSAIRDRAMREAEAAKSLKIDRNAVFPFGAAHFEGSEIPKFGFGPHFELGPNVIAAYKAWKTKVSAHSDIALCITGAELDRGVFPAFYAVKDYESGGAWVTAARNAIGEMERKAEFSGNIGFLSNYSHAVAFFLDRTVPEFDVAGEINYHDISRTLDKTEQLQIRLDIDRVQHFEDDRLILVFGKYKGSERVSIATDLSGAAEGAPASDSDTSAAELRRRR